MLLFHYRNQKQLSFLQRLGAVKLEGGPSEPLRTVHLMSDGMFLYWLYALRTAETVPHAVTGEKIKQHLVYLQVLKIKVCACA